MDRHIARTIVRNSAGDARVIWSIFSGYHPQELRESGAFKRSQTTCMVFIGSIYFEQFFASLDEIMNLKNWIKCIPVHMVRFLSTLV